MKYRHLAKPLPVGSLHTVYPGRPMLPEYHYTFENVPHEHPEELAKTRERYEALISGQMEREEMDARQSGAGDKVSQHPAVEPEALIEDPGLRALTPFPVPVVNPKQSLTERSLTGQSLAGQSLAEFPAVERFAPDEPLPVYKRGVSVRDGLMALIAALLLVILVVLCIKS